MWIFHLIKMDKEVLILLLSYYKASYFFEKNSIWSSWKILTRKIKNTLSITKAKTKFFDGLNFSSRNFAKGIGILQKFYQKRLTFFRLFDICIKKKYVDDFLWSFMAWASIKEAGRSQAKIQQTKMLVTCQRFGDLFLFGLVKV